MTLCGHKTQGIECGQPAVCAIVINKGRLSLKSETGDEMGRGVGSTYLPVCDLHKANYPDHEGIEL